MKYYGNWQTNNGNTFNSVPIESNNLKKLRKDLREIAAGNLTGPTDIGRWYIYKNEDDIPTDMHECIANGIVTWNSKI